MQPLVDRVLLLRKTALAFQHSCTVPSFVLATLAVAEVGPGSARGCAENVPVGVLSVQLLIDVETAVGKASALQANSIRSEFGPVSCPVYVP